MNERPAGLWPSPEREAAFHAWAQGLRQPAGLAWETLAPASADASFRRYLRVQGEGGSSFIVMDAPPALEDVRPFVHVAGLAQAAGLHVPRVLAADEGQGFLLLDDLGRELYIDALRDPARADALMRDALQALLRWQQGVPASTLPAFDEAVLREELALFPEWCVQREFGITWTARQQQAWQQLCDRLVASALAQPVVAVHRDWMPRNLMACPGRNPGLLDFQDAAAGPLTYDLASLLRDAFLSWDEAQELDWAVRWWQQARGTGLLGEAFEADFGEFWRALEWMGLQRHLRIMGIFCRLKQRDGKPRYTEDLPRFFGYATRVALRYAPLKPLLALLEPMSGQAVGRGFTF
ncbi:aminoglycoside phosphotransferase family protein [Pseudorhodoferax sp.]|uniref:aminoglycoside phosphotransferase family protein n=1 Tax=Pseudorhodoferax sp. TaxID=1993553 RepID=UPI002DD6A1B6|nr:phosphotransferase [Pseudorhodoferax sp.]